ncbi:MAG: MmcQ/YjbR family DNA-binding protein [Planctomycetota bacterium]
MEDSKVMQEIRTMALGFHGAEEGVSCKNAVFQAGGKNFLFMGHKDGGMLLRLKAVDKLAELEERAAAKPEEVGVGKGGWVTIHWPHTVRLPRKKLEGWITDSYRHLVPKKAQG